jgi:hypothetical protein
MTVVLTGWPLIVLTIVASAYAILGLAYGVVWLDVLRIKISDPERYAAFRDLRRARKGKR